LKILFFIIIFIFLPLCAEENQYEIVVKEKKKDSSTTAATSKVSAKDIEEGQKKNVADSVKEVPGVYVSNSGGPGSSSSVYVRGLRSDHVLIIIDGVKANSPIDSAGGYPIGALRTDNIAKIEVIRGAQTVLYGPSALAGVIIITTKKGSGPLSFSLGSETGVLSLPESDSVLNTFGAIVSAVGSLGSFHYSTSLSYFGTEGISTASEDLGNSEKDGYENKTFSLRGGMNIKGDSELVFTGRYIDAYVEIDKGGGKNMDDVDNVNRSKQFFFRPCYKFSLFDRWTHEISFGGSIHTLLNDEPEEREGYAGSSNMYEGYSLKGAWHNSLTLYENTVLKSGVEYERSQSYSILESYEVSESGWNYLDIMSFYASGELDLENLTLLAGSRLDNFHYDEKISDMREIVYNLGVLYKIDMLNSSLRLSIGRGVKPPSLFQIYSVYGSKELVPQAGVSVDGGVETYFIGRKIKTEVIYFMNRIDNFIDFDFHDKQFKNRYRIETAGFEISMKARPLKELVAAVNYTVFTNMKEYRLLYREGGKVYKKSYDYVLRRPFHMINISLNYKPLKWLNLNLRMSYNGETVDERHNPPVPPFDDKLSEFVVMNAAVSAKVTDYLTLYGRGENILNEKYEMAAGYGTPGISLFTGLKLTL